MVSSRLDYCNSILYGTSSSNLNKLQRAQNANALARETRQLKSSGHNLLEIHRMRTGFAQRSFTYNAPHIWNTLPRNITGKLLER